MLTIFLLFIIIHFPPAAPETLISPHTRSLQGEWRLLHESIGISAMHMQLLRNNKVVIFDRTDFGPSNISLPNGRCRDDPRDTALTHDCTAHSILYDVGSNRLRPLTIQTDPWCSSGSTRPDGTLIQTGGFNDGDHAVRQLVPCNDDSCDWVESPSALSRRRWYASNQILPDGRVIIVGGRAQFNYEFYPTRPDSIWMNFLRETRDQFENNLYPFLHLLPDGNLFIFANTRSIIFDYRANRIIREFPAIPGGEPRNYPSSGSSVLLPLDENSVPIEAEVMICGGSSREALRREWSSTFARASSTCGRLRVTDRNPVWQMETMPMPRVMGDMLLLPDGDVLVINGAAAGTAGWEAARNPVTRPLIYRQGDGGAGGRFSVMAASRRPRMYHSTAVLLPDGRILVGGSNPHVYYNFTGVDYPTDLSLEAFSPPYLSSEYDRVRPRVVGVQESVSYGRRFSVTFAVAEFMRMGVVTVRMIAPPFNTHSFSMNQRMVVLRVVQVGGYGNGSYRVDAVAPATAEIAPPGYYLLFVVHGGVPSSGVWVRVTR